MAAHHETDKIGLWSYLSLAADLGIGVLDLRNIETFVWIARLGGFRLAAEKLSTTQPAISARIAVLEHELGVRLFERKQRRAVLTGKGIELLALAEQMLQLRADMVSRVSASAALHGALRLGAIETVGHTWLSSLLRRIHTDYPSISLQITIDNTPDLRRAVIAHELDIAFLLGPIKEARVTSVPLRSYPVGWLASPDLKLPRHRLSLLELAAHPIISSRPHAPHARRILELFSDANLSTERIYSSSSISTIVHMARAGIGIGVVPLVVVHQYIDAGLLRLLDTECELPDAELTLTYPLKPESYVAAAVVVDLAREIASDYDAAVVSDKSDLSRPSKTKIGQRAASRGLIPSEQKTG